VVWNERGSRVPCNEFDGVLNTTVRPVATRYIRCREAVHDGGFDLECNVIGREAVPVDDVLNFQPGSLYGVDATQLEIASSFNFVA
jgi:hypothetical protein